VSAPRLEATAETVDLKHAFPLSARSWLGRRGVIAAVVAAVVVLATATLALRSRERVGAQPPPPGLEIATHPTDAVVFVDGVRMGNAPLFLTPVPAGVHQVKVTLEGFVPAELGLEVTGDGPPIPLRFTLQPTTGTLRIESEPSRASVTVDGQAVGVTPVLGLPLKPGGHGLRVESPGFRPWVRNVNASLGETIQVTARLEPVDDPTAGKVTRRTGGWVQRGDLVAMGPGVRAPRKISGNPAPSPEAARKLRLRGTVTVELTVTETGEVVEPRVVRSAGEILDQALLDAVRHWRYEPPDLNGLKVRVRIRESQTFGTTGG
jgi:TonB family protein